MRRREFITLFGGTAAVWPLAAHAQLLAKVPTIGYLGASTPETNPWSAAFEQRLREVGWVEGRTVAIEYRWAGGSDARAAEIAAEFVRLKVDVIVTGGDPIVRAIMGVTSVIPIVFGAAGDPVGNGLVASLARPGGNVTGLATMQTDSAGKRVELLHETVPDIRRLAIMAHVNLINGGDARGAEAAARTLGLDVVKLAIARAEDIAPTFGTLKSPADALYVGTSPFTSANRVRINSLALAGRLPTVTAAREFVEAGGLMSYGPNFTSQFRRAADFVDKILRGAKPADIPVEQATKFEFVVNLKTARALGLEVPPMLLARADEVIE